MLTHCWKKSLNKNGEANYAPFVILVASGLFFSSGAFSPISPLINFPTAYASSASSSAAEIPETSELSLGDRKQLLTDILSSALSQTNELANYLSALQTPNEEWDKIRGNLVSDLANFSGHYQLTIDKINDASSTITLEEIKKTARGLKDWQENIYSPEIDRAINASLILRADDFFNTTQSRFDKISADIKKLERQRFIKTNLSKRYLSDISRHLKNIGSSIDSAKKLYLKSSAAAEENSATSTDALSNKAEEKTSLQESRAQIQDTIRKTIQDALKELKTTYEIFFQINDRIKNGN